MNRFVQLHLLVSYPPSNLNRDDLGRPKTAYMGGHNRLRVSSQSLKRAWRTSEDFKKALNGHIGTRTKEMGREVYRALTGKGVSEKSAREWAQAIAKPFGKPKSPSKEQLEKDKLADLDIEQLAHFSPEERAAIDRLADTLAAENRAPAEEELHLLTREHSAVDIALFGRMLADAPSYRVEAAAQVAHAITVHAAEVEDDFFTAVDDLNTGEEDLGAGHMGETEFGAGVYYLYLCIDTESLTANLNGDAALAARALAALTEAAATVAPTGKQASFASRARAFYVLAEAGARQPRSLSAAFLAPVQGRRQDMRIEAIAALEKERADMERAYGGADALQVMDVPGGRGTLQEIIHFVTR